MWFFGSKKNKKAAINSTQQQPQPERLQDGELPFGWSYRNKDYIDKINSEYSYFLNNWINSRNGAPIDQYSALKSFVIYLEDVEKLCKSKGECFEFWFNEILTAPGHL